jgi:CRP-like cAMP-binding protein
MPLLHAPGQNELLAALPAAEAGLLLDSLELVPMVLGDVLYRSGIMQHHAYFPTTAVASLHYVTNSGAAAETAGVGREGMVGIAIFMGGGSTTDSAVVQTSGHGYRVTRAALLRAFEGSGPMRSVLLRYTQALITQVAQTAACYRHHSIEQQFSRLLLSTGDRSPAGELVMTQELVASMLGVRRESITVAASALQQGGYIRYRRGHISVIDRVGLQAMACECYGNVKQELRRLLTKPAERAPVAGSVRVTARLA